MSEPTVIQGGMGIGISNWKLAREVSRLGQLGVVSGTGIASILIRRLQTGDKDGTVRRALQQFPFQSISKAIIEKYFVANGIPDNQPFKRHAMYTLELNPELEALTVAANFVEVYLAKEGHTGKVGINLLEKIQLPTLPSLYGAMLAGVDYVLMGAGIPREIPGVLDLFAEQKPAPLKIAVYGSDPGTRAVIFDPARFAKTDTLQPLKRPKFLAIVSSGILARSLTSKSSGRIDGFVVETHLAGGHNAPPRGKMQLNGRGEPIYGAKDFVDCEEMRRLGTPFWLAGSFCGPEGLQSARQQGAVGIQVGTAFAFCTDSGLDGDLRAAIYDRAKSGQDLNDLVFTDPYASPTGMPFKAFQLKNTMADAEVYAKRPRKCDLGYLREAYLTKNGETRYRCASEPVNSYIKKDGDPLATTGRKCLCNALLATAGFAQRQESGYVEVPLLTTGNDLAVINRLLKAEKSSYSAADVIEYIQNPVEP